MPVKSSLRDKLDEDVLDLSLMQMSEVPVSEIALLPKGTTLDLSNNHLVYLPENFSMLTHLVKLDLSKNRLEELPEFFGQLKNLRHLDLYSNQLERLPVSFGQLKNLKWLDLKNNPLVPALQQAAGPCITPSDCTLCSKKVVALLQSMQSQMERERQRLAIEERKAEEQRLLLEEQAKERIRNEKRAAKERRRNDARAKEDLRRQQDLMKMSSSVDRESANGQGINNGSGNSAHQYNDYQANKGFEYETHGKNRNDNVGWCRSLMMLLLALLLVTVGSGISLLYIYTGGHLDHDSIERALPVLKRDVDHSFVLVTQKAEFLLYETQQAVAPLWKKFLKNGEWLWDEIKERNAVLLDYIYENWGPVFCTVRQWCQLRWQDVVKLASQGLSLTRPYFYQIGDLALYYSNFLVEKAKVHVPIFMNMVSEQINELWTFITNSVNNLMA